MGRLARGKLTERKKEDFVGLMHASTLNGLMLVLAVSEHGSINKAANALNISQPTLTRALRLFEGRIGGEVFVRTAKGVVLTQLGGTLVEHARAIRSESQKAQQTINFHRNSQSRFLAIGVVRVHPLVPFSQAVIDFHNAEPDARVQLIYGTPEEVIAFLRSGDVDIAFSSLVADTNDLHQESMFLDEIGVYARPQNALANNSDISISQFQHAAWVLGAAGSPARESLQQLFDCAGEAMPPIAIEADDTQIRKAMVCGSDLISAFHFHHVQKEVECGQLVRVGLPLPQTARSIGAISSGTQSKLAAKFLEILKACYREAELPRDFPLNMSGPDDSKQQ